MDLVHLTLIPDLGLGAHTASLGLTFYGQKMFPDKFHNGAFIGQHRSWNRSEFVGYKVVFVPLEKGKPTSAAEDFLTGFIASQGENDVESLRYCRGFIFWPTYDLAKVFYFVGYIGSRQHRLRWSRLQNLKEKRNENQHV